MGKISVGITLLVLGFVDLFANSNRYDIKSGIVEYEIVGNIQKWKRK